MLSDFIGRLSVSRQLLPLAVAAFVIGLNSCAPRLDNGSHMVVSVKEQKMLLVKDGVPVKTYPVSTSKFGLGNQPGSMKTPTGTLRVARKIGRGAPPGAVFKSRRRTGEVLRVNAPGRDPIVTRILWLDGQNLSNRNAFNRYIYIHGTPEERNLGRPRSYGCIRMASRDVIDLYDRVGVGAHVHIRRLGLPEIESPNADGSKQRMVAEKKGADQPEPSPSNSDGAASRQLTNRSFTGRRPGA